MTPPKSYYVTLPERDLRLHLLDWEGQSAQVLVCLHGLASSCHMFDLLAPQLSSSYRLIAPDQRGHGLSDKPSSAYDFESIASDLDALLLSLGLNAQTITLIGHSWGAYTSLYYAATRADKLEKLILLDGGVNRIADRWPSWEEARVAMAPPRFHNRSVEDIQTMIKKDWLGSVFRPELAPLALSIFDTQDPEDVHAHLDYDNHMQIAHALWAFDPAEYFSRVTCPTLIVNAVAPDQSITDEMQSSANRAQNGIAQAKLEWLHNTIHDIPWHRPHELAGLITRFLEEVH